MKKNLLKTTVLFAALSMSSSVFALDSLDKEFNDLLDVLPQSQQNQFEKIEEAIIANEKLLLKNPNDKAAAQRLEETYEKLDKMLGNVADEENMAGVFEHEANMNDELINSLPKKQQDKANKILKKMQENEEALSKNPNNKKAQKQIDKLSEQLDKLFDKADLFNGSK